MDVSLLDEHGHQNHHVMVQYWFYGPPVKLMIKPHGNSRTNKPFFVTAESAKKRHCEIASANKPSSAIRIATEECGGELQARGMSHLPRNLQQMKNYRRSGQCKDTNVLYSVMLQCKLVQGTADAFVRDIKAAPDPQCVLFFDWQLKDLVRFCTDSRRFSILTADTTYNLGEFYVTPTTYKHLMLVNSSQQHPVMAGPIFIHQRKDFASFNYFASTLVCFEKLLKDICAFGTDGDPALIEAFSHAFPNAKQLRCFIHMKQNISSKLKDRGLPSSVIQEFICDIFGKRYVGTYEEGLVDSIDAIAFCSRVKNCKNIWEAREKVYLQPDQDSFFEYFMRYYAEVISTTMLRGTRISVGLGLPPTIFTTNSSESLNAALKRKESRPQGDRVATV